MNCLPDFATICRPDVSLAPYTWYRLGGPARWFAEPRDEAELSLLLSEAVSRGIAWRVLGRGANLLVRDGGFDGLVIHLSGQHFERIEIDESGLTAGAAADFPRLIRKAIAGQRVGLEALAGIPGSFGGILRMNAGGKYGEIGAFVESVDVVRADGSRASLPHAAVNFRYRKTDLGGCVIVAGRLRLPTGDAEAALLRHRDVWNEKAASQPAVAERSCGCIFKNPPGRSAGKLLDEAGLKGAAVGGARISERHANFIVATEGATAADVLNLIAQAQERVRSTAGVDLQLEVEIW